MGIIVQRHGDVGVAHDVLQCFGVHTGVCHAGTECVPLCHNKDKSESPCAATGFGFVFILFPFICPAKIGITRNAKK